VVQRSIDKVPLLLSSSSTPFLPPNAAHTSQHRARMLSGLAGRLQEDSSEMAGVPHDATVGTGAACRWGMLPPRLHLGAEKAFGSPRRTREAHPMRASDPGWECAREASLVRGASAWLEDKDEAELEAMLVVEDGGHDAPISHERGNPEP